ncbi:peptide ABC transporter substrate-binding protein [Blastomonas sp. AAP53]|uniref:peptide ABC transporter substrate-binding protein n=1 Tax=Blastomonas sp. AAP53 TaxID=1248760 RepID=UPI0002ED9DB0|nr:peptide ABC transporter substrate-binding protein [Blastomonas sp. AAP53]
MLRILPLLFALLLTACSGESASSGSTPEPGRLVRLADAEIRGLDPQVYSDLASLRVAADQFEGLTRFDGAGQPVAGLARRWSISPDGRSWAFTLRPGLRFSDGTPIKAEAFTQVWQRLNAPATGSPHTALFTAIANIQADGDDIVTVRLHAPFPQLPALLAHPAMAALPLHRATEDWTAERPLVTSGPYRTRDWRLNDRLVLERNPHWHAGRAKIATVVWKPVDDALAGMRLFLAGGADISGDYPQSRHAWLAAQRPGAVRTGDYLGSYYFTLNTRKPPFDDSRVRRALGMAVNRAWIARALLPMGNAPAFGIVPPALHAGAAVQPGWAGWPLARRQREARRLLAQAGYSPARPLRFEIRINSSAEHRRMAVALAAMWKPLGVEASILNSEPALHFAAMRRGDFQMARSGWIADLPAPENFLAVHRSDAGEVNYSGHADREFDALLDAAMAQGDPVRRTAAMRAAEARLIDAMPVIPLWFYRSGALVSPRVAGWTENPGNIHPSAALSLRHSPAIAGAGSQATRGGT